MLQQVKRYIKQNNLIDSSESKIIVGVSGGADSVALLDMLLQIGYNCVVAHCNFHLRGEESDRDCLFVKKLCQSYNVILHIVDFDTEKYAADNSVSIEMAARELRYNWFEEIRQKEQAPYIAVAHHSDDSVETILLNLVRGTGIRGLTGISPKNGSIIRPLLCLNRSDILGYLESRGILYVNDYTNFEDIYSRNRVRLKVLPLLETINSSAKASILDTAKHLLQVEHIYNSYIETTIKYVFDGHKIDINKLRQQLESQAILFELLYKYQFNKDIIDQVYKSLNSQSGKIFYSKTHKLIKDRDYLLLTEISEDNSISEYAISENGIKFPIQLQIAKQPIRDLQIKKDSHFLYLDYDKIKFPLILRKWERGDWFIPFGMRGRKKISDYFSDNKFSLIGKENTWLLCNGNDIVWIVGHRSDDRYKITDKTKDVIVINYTE